MNDEREHDEADDRAEYARELRNYIIGFVGAVALTALAFAMVALHLASRDTSIAVVFVLALVQVIVHFRFFLHIDLTESARDDLQLILFSALITAMMVGGTLVVLFNLRQRMM